MPPRMVTLLTNVRRRLGNALSRYGQGRVDKAQQLALTRLKQLNAARRLEHRFSGNGMDVPSDLRAGTEAERAATFRASARFARAHARYTTGWFGRFVRFLEGK